VFENGICYEFIHGSTLSMETCRSPKVYPIVAAEMAKIHSKITIDNDNGDGTELKSMMWDKFKTFNDLVEEIFKTNPELVKR